MSEPDFGTMAKALIALGDEKEYAAFLREQSLADDHSFLLAAIAHSNLRESVRNVLQKLITGKLRRPNHRPKSDYINMKTAYRALCVLDLEAAGWNKRDAAIEEAKKRLHCSYCCFEGQSGISARVEAFRQRFLPEDSESVPFFLQPAPMDLIKEHGDLITAIREHDSAPVTVVLDTLNRSLAGSENSDEDMGAYIKATDAIREAFDCSVLVVHHCGINDSRPRGHTSLTGAADARLAVTRDAAKNILVDVEFMKDGEAGQTIFSALESIEVGVDQDGDVITSCVVVPSEAIPVEHRRTKLTANQQTMFDVLVKAGRPLTTDEWTDQATVAGLSSKRRAWAWDLRNALQKKGLVYEGVNGWSVNS